MALKIDEVMELSLDDYIKMSKPSNCAENTNNSNNLSTTSNGSSDDKFGRRKGNIDDEEDDEEDSLYIDAVKDEPFSTSFKTSGEDTGVWKGPESSISYIDCHDNHNDLREKLRNNQPHNIHNNNNINHGQLSSIQYRLQAPNNFANRPRGIPTLLPLDAYVRQNNTNQFNGRNRGGNRNRRKTRNGGGGNMNGIRSYNNVCNHNNFGGNAGGVGGIVNRYIQRNRQQDLNSKNIGFTINRNDIHLTDTVAPQNKVRNMVIETPSQFINLNQSGQLNNKFQIPNAARDTTNRNPTISIGNLTPQAQAALNLSTNTNQLISTNNNDSLKNLLGFQGDVSGDMMPVFASRLLEFIQNGSQAPVHKPMYDMKIQKDIHEIQKKPLLYKCPGGEVVSSDGAGVNCQIIPRTSGVSLNCRFA